MANFDTSKKGMKSYAVCLDDARVKGEIGVHKHLRQPQPATSRMGMVGKPASASTLKFLAEKGVLSADRVPAKAVKAKATKAPADKVQAEVERLRTMLDEQSPEQSRLRAKLEAEQKAKLAKTLEVPEYGRNVYLKMKNSVG